MVIFKHVAKGRQGPPRAAKGFQGPRGTPGMGEMSFNQIDHFPTWYSKSGRFPIENPIKNENLSLNAIYCL